MDAQQRINLAIKSEFAQQQIEFAYPTQINYFHNLPTDAPPNNHQEHQQPVIEMQ